MRLEDAKRFYDRENEESLTCDVEGCDGEMVKYGGDKVCNECGYMYDTYETDSKTVLLAERRWVSHNDRNGSGFYGHDRVRFVGGYEEAWFDEDGRLQL